MSKPTKRASKPFNTRKTFVFDEPTYGRAKVLAKTEKNSVSKELRVLVDREYERLFPLCKTSKPVFDEAE